MDGIFVAYHNTAEIFGFQYIPLEEMDIAVAGNTFTADSAYRCALELTHSMMDQLLEVLAQEGRMPGKGRDDDTISGFKLTVSSNPDEDSVDIYIVKNEPIGTKNRPHASASYAGISSNAEVRKFQIHCSRFVNDEPLERSQHLLLRREGEYNPTISPSTQKQSRPASKDDSFYIRYQFTECDRSNASVYRDELISQRMAGLIDGRKPFEPNQFVKEPQYGKHSVMGQLKKFHMPKLDLEESDDAGGEVGKEDVLKTPELY